MHRIITFVGNRRRSRGPALYDRHMDGGVLIKTLIGLLAAAVGGCTRAAPDVGAPIEVNWTAVDPVVAETAKSQIARIKQDPSAALPRATLAMIYHANAMPDAAVESYQQALQLDRHSAALWYYLAHCRAELGHYHSALAALDQVDQIEEGHAPSAWWRGYWLLELGRVDDAAEAFDRAAALEPKALPVRIGQARVQMCQSEIDQATAALEAIVRDYPTLAYAQQLLGTAHRLAGRIPEARQALLQSDGTKPAWDDPWLAQLTQYAVSLPRQMARIDLLIDTGQTDSALTLIQALQSRRPDDVAVLGKLGELYMARNDLGAALSVLERSARINPNYFPVHLHLSAVYQQRGDLKKAMQHADRAIELNPTFGEAHRRRAQVSTAMNDWPATITSLEQAMRLGMNDESTLISLGRLYMSSARWSEAAHTLQIACHRYPQNGDGWYGLARAAAELGQVDAASSALQKAMRLKPQSEEARAISSRIEQARAMGGR
jgi:tetratricopeptide (TPR) repeat protein